MRAGPPRRGPVASCGHSHGMSGMSNRSTARPSTRWEAQISSRSVSRTPEYQTLSGYTATVMPWLQCLRQLVRLTITRSASPRSLTIRSSLSKTSSDPFSPHDPLGFPGGRPRGRHPWPSEEQVSRVMRAAGIGPGVRVVAYDDQAGAIAARLWYLLQAHGHEDVAVLDGGIVKWTAEGRALETVSPPARAARFTARLRPGSILTKEDMAAASTDRLVLDARAPDRYRGDAEPIDPRAGPTPGAKGPP